MSLPVLASGHDFALSLSPLAAPNTATSDPLTVTFADDTTRSNRIKWADRHNHDMHPSISQPVPHGLIHTYDGSLEDIPEHRSMDDDSSSDHSSSPSEIPNLPLATTSEPTPRTWTEWFKSFFRWMGYLSLIAFIYGLILNQITGNGAQVVLYQHGLLPNGWIFCRYDTSWPVDKSNLAAKEKEAAVVAKLRLSDDSEKGHVVQGPVGSGGIADEGMNVKQEEEVGKHHVREDVTVKKLDSAKLSDKESTRNKVDRILGWAWLANH